MKNYEMQLHLNPSAKPVGEHIYAQYDNTCRNYLMKNYRRWGKIERSNQAQDQPYGSLTLF